MFSGSSIYSPLPQSNSESDEFSEEELRSLNSRQEVNKSLGKREKESGQETMLNDKAPGAVNYKKLGDEGECGITLTGVQIGSEAPASTTNKNVHTLSPARKFFFFSSMFLCLFTTIFFLWLLPCEFEPCPRPTAISMKKVFSHIEISGPISVVSGAAKDKVELLIFLFRKSFTGEKVGYINGKLSGGNGVVSILTGNREPSWWIFTEKEATDIDCNVLDLNLDGVKDCLVVGKSNLLISFESLSGKQLWHFNGGEAFTLKRCNFEFPLVLPDLNGDGVAELLSVCAINGGAVSHHQNFFVLISGKTGAGIGKPAEITECSGCSVYDLSLEKEYVIFYKCFNLTNEDSFNNTFPLQDIILNLNSSTAEKSNTEEKNTQVIRHKTSRDAIPLYLDGRRFNLKNEGHCPGQCNMIVKIEDDRDYGVNQTVWTIRMPNSYGMFPVGLKCGNFSTFVFKYWQWESDDKKDEVISDNMNSNNDYEDEEEWGKNIFRVRSFGEAKSLDYDMFGGDMPESARYKRTLVRKTFHEVETFEGNIYRGENLTFYNVVERTILICFNETNVHIIHTSQYDVIQICRNRNSCQPDAKFKKQSMFLKDVDKDNYKELISYSSTFVNVPDRGPFSKGDMWQLQSVVEVIKLERELNKMYAHIH